MADIGIINTIPHLIHTVLMLELTADCGVHVVYILCCFAGTLRKAGVQDVFVLCTEAELRR